MYDSLKAALDGEGCTQEELVERVRKLRMRRSDGKLLTLSQTFTSQLVTKKRVAGRLLAKAISRALNGKISRMTLMLGSDADENAA
jgi:hypothetical protein